MASREGPGGAALAAIDELYLLRNGRPRNTKRGAEFLRVLPVLFVTLVGLFLYTVYIGLHSIPLLKSITPAGERENGLFKRAIIELVVLHWLLFWFVIAFVRAIITPPGTIPDLPEWTQAAEDPLLYHETKGEGTRRFCKWCNKYKPDRTHHCRQCRRCVLKMDHHCPWTYNCVGWGNHKFFINLLFYSTLCTIFIAGTQIGSVIEAKDSAPIRFGIFVLLLFAESLSCLLAISCLGFLGFHLWLVIHNTSTIEFCEKHFRRRTVWNVYDRGSWKNFGDAFGYNPILWFLPIDNRAGDGLHFPVRLPQSPSEARLYAADHQRSVEEQPLQKEIDHTIDELTDRQTA